MTPAHKAHSSRNRAPVHIRGNARAVALCNDEHQHTQSP